MNHTQGINIIIPTPLYLAVQAHRKNYRHISMAAIVVEALESWMAQTRSTARAQSDTGRSGYQWKSLFLPEGSKLRAVRGQSGQCARVVNNQLVHLGLPMSPHQLVRAECGPGRNAWTSIMVCLSGQDRWRTACSLRKEMRSATEPPMPTPSQVLLEASQAMSEVLRNALALVEKSALPALPEERRVERHRRASDLMPED